MLIFSYNMRGIGGEEKIRALGRFILNTKLELVLVQETMYIEVKSYEYFLKNFPSWEVCAMDYVLGFIIIP